MKLTQLLLATALTLLLSTAALGEFYKYTDKEGIVHYTDDLSAVPENQRPSVANYESNNVPVAMMKNKDPDKISSKEGEKVSESQKKRAELDRIKRKQIETYKELNEKRKALGDPPPEHAKSGVKAAYIRKTKQLNEKIKEYNKLSKELEKLTNEYNRGKS